MRLLIGEPGSGKTTRILDEVRGRLRSGRDDFRLVTPTSTMAEHVRNSLAREGLVVRPAAIVTIAGFVEPVVPDVELASQTAVELLVRAVLEERKPRAFLPLLSSPGFAPALASVLEELANAGCDSLQWSALRGLGVHKGAAMEAVGSVYEGLEEELRKRGLWLRAAQLAEAARRIRGGGLAGVREVWFDGFFSFTLGELEIIRALKAQARVTVALPEWSGAAASREELLRMGCREERLHPVRQTPRTTLTGSASREREAEEIALRILEMRAAGRPWREMGVVLRSRAPYEALLLTTFARLGIPARSYFAQPLAGHPVCRMFAQSIEAALSGWEHERTAAALRSGASVAGECEAAGRFEYAVREALPGQGLASLKEIAGGVAGGGALVAAIELLEEQTPWATDVASPAEWAGRLRSLVRFVAPPAAEGAVAPETLRVWRARSAAVASFGDAMAEVAGLLGEEPMLLEGFWRHAGAALHGANLRVADARRDVVHLLDVYEARQWELPAVFVCGLVEGEFPRHGTPDPVLGDETRRRLRANGVPVTVRADAQAEEDFLFRFALTRATGDLALSWPMKDAEGHPTLRAFAVEGLNLKATAGRTLRVRASAPAAVAPRPALQSDDVLAEVRKRHARQRPTALEVFLQCPFQFFASRTLRLEEPPARPGDRLDRLAQGTLMHEVIADWHRGLGTLEELFERHWRELLRKLRVPPSHRTEVTRLLILRSLRFYEQDARIQPGWAIGMEKELEIEVEGVRIRGRADRVDVNSASQCVVYDFKFSGESGLKRRWEKLDAGLLVQGGLYMAALKESGLSPVGFHFAGLRGETNWRGSDDLVEVSEITERALAAARDSIHRIAEGDISVRPADPEACAYCAFRHGCRVESVEQPEIATA